ncbi:MAG: ABC transporter permease [Halodesulfurarchaeum sp.]
MTIGFGSIRDVTLVLAVLSVQAIAFASAFLLGIPTAYAVFAIVSAAAIAYGSGKGRFETVLAVFGTVLLLALGLPLIMLIARQQPRLILAKALSPQVQQALYLSIYGPLLSALFVTVLGVPLAYVFTRGFPGEPLVASLVDLPLVVPHSVAGLAVLFAFGEGAVFPQLSVYGTLAGMVLAMAFVSAPFAVNATREAFEAIDTRVEQASRSLGASEWETFRRVQGPLAVRGILTGGLLAWARSVSEFGAVAMVAYNVEFFYLFGGETATAQHAPVYIYNAFLSQGLAESGAIAFLLLVVCATIFVLVRWLAYDSADVHGGIV